MKFKHEELTPGEQYGVLFWQGEYHVVRIDAISPSVSDLKVRWIASGLPSFEAAQRNSEESAKRVELHAERDAAGLCACGLPYEAHNCRA